MRGAFDNTFVAGQRFIHGLRIVTAPEFKIDREVDVEHLEEKSLHDLNGIPDAGNRRDGAHHLIERAGGAFAGRRFQIVVI